MSCGPFDPAIFDPAIFDVCSEFEATLLAESAPGVWTDIGVDRIATTPLRWSKGIFERGPGASVARPGTINFTLDNSQKNSQQTLGLYTPGHASSYAWWKLEVRVKLRLSKGAVSRYVWSGRLKQILPDAGVHGPRRVTCMGVDWMAEFARQDAINIELLENVRADEGLTALVALIPNPPAHTQFDVGVDTYEFVFDDLGGRIAKAMPLANDLVISDAGMLVLRGDDDEGETLRYFSRLGLMLADVETAITGEHLLYQPANPHVAWDSNAVVNSIEVQTPRRRTDDAATSLLVTLDRPLLVAAGQTVIIENDYKDPNGEAIYVGGADMQPMSPNIDWTANTEDDGTGTDITADFTVTAGYGGSRATITATNNGTVDGFVRGPLATNEDGALCRGRGLYRYSAASCRAENAASIAAHGECQASAPMVLPYQSNPVVSMGIGQLKTQIWGGMTPQPQRVRVLTEKTDEMMEQGILRDVGDKITVTESLTAVNEVGVIIAALEGEILENILRTWWILLPVDDTESLIFDDPVRGTFDENAFSFG